MSDKMRNTRSGFFLPHDSELETLNLTRRQLLTLAASASAGLVLAACAPGTLPLATPGAPTAAVPLTTTTPAGTVNTLPPPETTTIRISLNSCDAPIMAAESFLREEGFTDVQLTDAATATALPAGKVDLGNLFPTALAGALQDGVPVVNLGGIHPGCVDIWAPQSVATLKDLVGHTVVVQAKTIQNVPYSDIVLYLKQLGVDPKDVNFVVQPDADLVKLYLDGKNDAVVLPAAADEALRANPANKGHSVFSLTTEEPWAHTDCCFVVTTQAWYQAHPIAAKRAMRAILRAADALPADRADAAKAVTDKGLFGGAKNFANVHNAVNMLSFNWRDLDAEKSLRLHAGLLADTGLLKLSADDLVKSIDLRILNELRTELKKPS